MARIKIIKMKKSVSVIIVYLFLVCSIFYSCKEADKKSKTASAQTKQEQYQCPMKCTEQKFEKPGTCPECGMELEKINAG